MGLDYTISLVIKDKESTVKRFEMDVAYWRKCWKLSEVLHDLSGNNRYSVPEKYRDEYDHVCSVTVLDDIIKCIKHELDEGLDNDFWDCGIWSRAVIRDQSIRNLANLYALQAWLNDQEDYEILRHADYDNSGTEWFEEYLKTKDKYELFIVSDFSY